MFGIPGTLTPIYVEKRLVRKDSETKKIELKMIFSWSSRKAPRECPMIRVSDGSVVSFQKTAVAVLASLVVFLKTAVVVVMRLCCN